MVTQNAHHSNTAHKYKKGFADQEAFSPADSKDYIVNAGVALEEYDQFRKAEKNRIRSEDRDKTVGKRQSSMAEYSNLYDKYFEK